MKFQAKSWSATGAASIISFFLQQLKLQCAAWHERSVDYNQHLILNSDRTHWTHDNASKRSTSPGIMFLHFLLAAVKEAGYFFVVHTCFAFAIFCKSKSNNNTVYISNNCQVYFKWRMCRTWCSCMAEQVWNMKPLWCWLQCWWRWCSCHKKNEIEPQRALQHWQPAKNNQCSLPSKKTQKEDKNEGTLYSTVWNHNYAAKCFFLMLKFMIPFLLLPGCERYNVGEATANHPLKQQMLFVLRSLCHLHHLHTCHTSWHWLQYVIQGSVFPPCCLVQETMQLSYKLVWSCCYLWG